MYDLTDFNHFLYHLKSEIGFYQIDFLILLRLLKLTLSKHAVLSLGFGEITFWGRLQNKCFNDIWNFIKKPN